MRFPFVSRYRLELKDKDIEHLQAEVARLEVQVKDLTAANTKAFELAELEKEQRMRAEARLEEEPEPGVTRSHRMMGADIRQRADSWARQRKAEKG